MTETITEEITDPFLEPYTENHDPDHRTHVINPPMNTHIWHEGMSVQEIVNIARVTQQEVIALCGYRWVPRSNPDKHDACTPCFKIAGDIIASKN